MSAEGRLPVGPSELPSTGERRDETAVKYYPTKDKPVSVGDPAPHGGSSRVGRGGGTRTRDLVLPKHVRYQATLLPERGNHTQPAADAR